MIASHARLPDDNFTMSIIMRTINFILTYINNIYSFLIF